jgi:hypothetical protein
VDSADNGFCCILQRPSHPTHHKRWNPETSNLQYRHHNYNTTPYHIYPTRCIAFLISDNPPRDTLYSHDPTGQARLEDVPFKQQVSLCCQSMENAVLYACLISRCLCRSGLVDQDRETFSCWVLQRVSGKSCLQGSS